LGRVGIEMDSQSIVIPVRVLLPKFIFSFFGDDITPAENA
jgi:hypothetical protein